MPTNFATPLSRASSISCAPIIRLSKKSWPGFSRLNPMPPTLAARWMTRSMFLTARRQFSRSTRFRVLERGTAMSFAPAASSCATTRDPRKPAPPVTSTRRPVQKLIGSDYSRDLLGVCSPEMRILYDDSLARNPAGTGTFVRGLRGGLQARTDIELVTVRASLNGASDLDVPRKRLGGRLGRAGAHLRHYLVDLPGQARAQGCDAIFCPTSLGPLRGRIPSFITLFDLTPWRWSTTMDAMSRRYFRFMLDAGLKRSAGVCTISESVAGEIRERFPRRRGAVVVAHPGPNPELVDAAPVPAPIPDAPFLLMVGTLEPRKNHLTVLRALADHLRRHPDSELRVVLAGAAGWLYEPVLAAITELGLDSRVSRLGRVEPGTLKWLYQRAAALAFPSIYEGFGLPVLEAFTFGCPVLAARIPSVLEIAGPDSAMLLDPGDVPAWAAAVDVVEGGRLPSPMVEAARIRAQGFTWAGCAESVVTLIAAGLDRTR